jgi:hypothetical protein
MRLTNEEFKRIRPLEWCVKNIGGTMMNTPINQTFTQLFWIDFMRNVFAKKFKNQTGIQSIANFDTSTPVLLSDEMDLRLPTLLETVAYYADNKEPPVSFRVPIVQTIPYVLGMLILLVVTFIALLKKPSMKNDDDQLFI